MVPAQADHATAALPVTLHCDVAPGAIDAGVQEIETEVAVGDCETVVGEELPQPALHSRTVPAAKTPWYAATTKIASRVHAQLKSTCL